MENEVKGEENVTSQPVQPQVVVPPVEQPKTKRKGRGPLYWIIVIIGVGLIVYLSMGIGEKLGRLAELESGDSKTDTKEESNSNNFQELDEEEAKKYVDNYSEFFSMLSTKGLTDETKVNITFGVLPTDIEVVDTTNMKCEDAFDDCYEGTHDGPTGFSFIDNGVHERGYKYDNINKYYQELFGSKNNISKLDARPSEFTCLEYSSKLNSWIELEAQFGGACLSENDIYYVIDSATEKDNKVNITLTYIEYDETYLNDDCQNEINGYSYVVDGVEGTVKTETEIANVLTKNHDKLSHLTFTFEKEKDNYILTSVTK